MENLLDQSKATWIVLKLGLYRGYAVIAWGKSYNAESLIMKLLYDLGGPLTL